MNYKTISDMALESGLKRNRIVFVIRFNKFLADKMIGHCCLYNEEKARKIIDFAKIDHRLKK